MIRASTHHSSVWHFSTIHSKKTLSRITVLFLKFILFEKFSLISRDIFFLLFRKIQIRTTRSWKFTELKLLLPEYAIRAGAFGIGVCMALRSQKRGKEIGTLLYESTSSNQNLAARVAHKNRLRFLPFQRRRLFYIKMPVHFSP